MLPTPRALLLDFGGVLADGPDLPDWQVELAGVVREVLVAAGVAPVPEETVIEALTARGSAVPPVHGGPARGELAAAARDGRAAGGCAGAWAAGGGGQLAAHW